MHRSAGAAAVFGTANAQNPQPCRHEIEHLADRLADDVERATAAGTDALINIDRHILARQMVGKSLPMGRRLRTDIRRRCSRMACLQAGNIGVEVFQSESKLVAIDPLRAPSELRALESPDDELQSLDLRLRLRKLRSIVRHLRSQVAHQLVQRIDVRRQCGKIDVHAQNLTRVAVTPRDHYHRESIGRRQIGCLLSRRQQGATGAQARASRPHQSSSTAAPSSAPVSHPDRRPAATGTRPVRAAW
jgi:hypothetical protein